MAPAGIRNVVLVGHSGSGKTALAEALLYAAGVTTRMGRIEDGNTVSDFEPEEISRGSSVSLAMAPFEWSGHRINIIDTPGYSDFIGDARAAMRAADLALFVEPPSVVGSDELLAVRGKCQAGHIIRSSQEGRLNLGHPVKVPNTDFALDTGETITLKAAAAAGSQSRAVRAEFQRADKAKKTKNGARGDIKLVQVPNINLVA